MAFQKPTTIIFEPTPIKKTNLVRSPELIGKQFHITAEGYHLVVVDYSRSDSGKPLEVCRVEVYNKEQRDKTLDYLKEQYKPASVATNLPNLLHYKPVDLSNKQKKQYDDGNVAAKSKKRKIIEETFRLLDLYKVKFTPDFEETETDIIITFYDPKEPDAEHVVKYDKFDDKYTYIYNGKKVGRSTKFLEDIIK